jgi:type IV secretion system protein VirB10
MKHMKLTMARNGAFTAALFATILLICFAVPGMAQETPGPQPSVAPVAAPAPAAPRPAATVYTVPAGTRLAVVLENGISTRNAKRGDSVYLRTSFPVTQENHVVIPVGSYLRGSLLDAKRPGRVKGRGEFRIRLETLILPNGYTVNLLAAPRSADSGGKETIDSEGKVTGPGGKGQDVGTVITPTVTGAGIGAIAGGGRGAGIGAGIGAAVGLGAVLLTRGPEAQLPRGSSMDVVLERDLRLDSSWANFQNVGSALPVTPPPQAPALVERPPYPY